MATNINAGTLTVTLSEALVLNDSQTTADDHGLTVTQQFTIGTVKTIVHRICEITTGSETGVMSFAASEVTAPGVSFGEYVAGHFDENEVVYLRFTNHDTANAIVLVFRSAQDAEFAVRLDAGQTFIYPCDNAAGTAGTMDAGSSPIGVSLENLEDVTADALTGSCDLEVFAALI